MSDIRCHCHFLLLDLDGWTSTQTRSALKFRALGVCVHSGWVLRAVRDLARGPTNQKMAFISVRRLLSILKESKHKKCCIFCPMKAVEPKLARS
jgi:hypothetical protein